MVAPVLKGEARKAVQHRGSHLQIIAAAGSGKTEVVSQRVVSLLADGVPGSAIVAFTFSERAAAELEGLDMRGAYLHDLEAGKRTKVDITDAGLAQAEVTVLEASDRLRTRDYTPDPGPKCRKREVRAVCGSARK